MIGRLICICFLSVTPVAAAAQSAAFEVSIRYHSQPLEKVGQGTLTWLAMDVYDIALYAPGGDYRPNSIHAIELVYDFSFTSEELVEETIHQLRRMHNLPQTQLARWEGMLNSLGLSVERGDRVRMVTHPGDKVVFYHNGRYKGAIDDSEFSHMFSKIWLGERSQFPRLARQVRGGV